jgi:hypothetical protein
MATCGSTEPPLFVMHIPKTAGTTLAWIVKQQYRPADVCHAYPGHLEQILEARNQLRSPTPPRAVIGHYRFGLHDGILPAPRYVTLVRDPIDQVLSNFNYMAGSDDPLHKTVLSPGTDIDEFADHDQAGNLQTQFLTNQFRVDIEADPEGAYRKAIETIETQFVGVGTVEAFDASVRVIADRVGWRVRPAPRLNQTPDRPGKLTRWTVSPATLARIAAANEVDARVHEYATRAIQAAGRRRTVWGWFARRAG